MTFVKTALFHKAGEGSGGGGGGGDQHNLGWYATESALTTAHATATDGDWAIVGATDTVWVWDSDTTAWKDTGQAGIELPVQTGNSGKFLTTNGTAASWSDKIKLGGSGVSKIYGDSNGIAIGNYYSSAVNQGTAVGGDSKASVQDGTAIGWKSQATAMAASALGPYTTASGRYSIAIGPVASATAERAYQIGVGTNSTAHSLSVGTYLNDTINNYQLLDLTDGTIPEARLADTTNAQQGDVLTLDSNGDAVWQASSGGGLQNTATGTNSLTILGTPATSSGTTNIGVGSSAGVEGVAIGGNASCSNAYVAIGYGAQASAYGIGIGKNVKANGNTCIGIGYMAEPTGNSAISIGAMNKVTGAYSIQLGGIGFTNSEPGTFCVGLGNGGNYFPNYKLLDSDGTIPTARLTKVNSTITLTVAGWSNGSQTVTVSGVTSSSIVWVSPDPTDQSAYVSAGILCTAQGTDSLTFTATTTPSADIDVVVVAM